MTLRVQPFESTAHLLECGWSSRLAPPDSFMRRAAICRVEKEHDGNGHMTQTLAETLLLASVAINAALLDFIAGVLRKVMNDMDEPAFKHFVESLVRHSSRSPFLLTALNIPAFGAIPYYYVYGFGNRWLTAGLALWLAAGLAAKMIKLPIYKAVDTTESSEIVRLRELRRRLNGGNLFQAILNSASVVLITIAFIK